jgi:hypothetical protein
MNEAARNEPNKKIDDTMGKGASAARGAFAKVEDLADKAGFGDVVRSEPAKAVISAVEGGISQAGEWVEGAGEYLGDFQKKTTSTIRQYPIQAVLIGFGVGALVATLVAGSSRRA